ncbi:MAG: hypothetical protein M3Y28_02695 [Armatimonadota bacterium]|nr:hypothetical protein [Armatimonadota bacterium]
MSDTPDTDVERAARERKEFRTQIEDGLALRRRLLKADEPPVWPERLRARVSRRLVPPPNEKDSADSP